MADFAELRDRDGRSWRCTLPPEGVVVVAPVQADWSALLEGIDEDERPEVEAGWWMVEAEAGRAAVASVDRRRRRLARAGIALLVATVALALAAWAAPVPGIPREAKGGLGFLVLVLLGLPALGVYLAGTESLQFGIGLRERHEGRLRAERADGELQRLGRLRSSMIVVADTLPGADAGALAAVVRRALAMPGVARTLVVTPLPGRRDALATALGRAVESATLAAKADA